MQVILGAVVIVLMIVGCYVLSGSSLIEGTIFERKTPVGKSVEKK